jgi:tRNA(Ile2) C34 agmatinyltransferase TiaS
VAVFSLTAGQPAPKIKWEGSNMVNYDGYPMCDKCGVELEFEGSDFYYCPICNEGFSLEPPSASDRKRIREAAM